MDSIKTVIVLGASGVLGQAMIPVLVDAGFQVTALSRPGSKPCSWSNVANEAANYGDVARLTKAFRGQDAVVEAFNPSAATHQGSIIKAAIAAGVKHLITPEFGPDTFNKNLEEVMIYEPKIKAQGQLEELMSKDDESLSWTGIITGAWYDWAIKNGKFWISRESRTIMRFGSGNQRYSISRLETVAMAVATALKNPEKYRNRPMYVANHTVSTNDLIAMVKKVGGGNWSILDAPLDGLMNRGRELWLQDTASGVENRLETQAYPMLGTAAIFDEDNRYGADFGDKTEPDWKQSDETLVKELETLLG